MTLSHRSSIPKGSFLDGSTSALRARGSRSPSVMRTLMNCLADVNCGHAVQRRLASPIGLILHIVLAELRRAVSLACQVAFEEFGFRRLEVVTDADNSSSRRVALRSGFSETGLRDGRILHIKELREQARGSE